MIDLAEFIRIFSEKIVLAVTKKALREDLHLLDEPLRDIDISEEGKAVLLKNLRGRS